jgi:hypothetical protein
MKAFLFFFAITVFSCSAMAENSDSASVSRIFFHLQQLPVQLSSSVESLSVSGQNLDNEVIEGKIMELLKPLVTESFAQEWKVRIDKGLALKWQLANCDDFCWALPVIQSEYFRLVVKVNMFSDEAAIICSGRTPDALSLPEKVLQDSSMYCSFAKDPNDLNLKMVKWVNAYKTMFIFKKMSDGWKVSGFREKVVQLNLAAD